MATNKKNTMPESNDREVPPIGQREDGTAVGNEANQWPEGTVGPNGRPARVSERGQESADIE